MNVEIITIGDEILIGQVVDTNAAFIGQELTKIGMEVSLIKSIHDDRDQILRALQLAGSRAKVVVVTGGLGPTKDDITKHTFCEYFEDHLVENKSALEQVKKIFAKFDRPMLQVNIDQAKLPSQATVLNNKYGTAPGMWFEKEGVVYVSLPGVPFEMKHLLKEEVIPRLVKKFERHYILQKTVLTYGLGESFLADKLKNWENNLPENMSLAYLPSPGRVRLRLMARGMEEAVLKDEMESQLMALHEIIGDIIGGYEGESSLQSTIAQILRQQKKTLAISESCTGGKLAVMFTEMPGASAYFKGGLIPYETQMKVDILGVSSKVIEKHSVVSAEVAEAMAEQTRLLFKSDFALSTTGNAGPTKGDSDAEIGTVFIGLATPEGVTSFALQLGNHRERVVRRAVFKALEILKAKLL